jgi:hypothetical protein
VGHVDCNINEVGAEFGDRQFDYANESDGLTSLQDSDSKGVRKRKKKYRQFNEKHDLKILVTFAIGDQFAYAYFFKRILKTFAVQNRFNYHYKHNDMGRVSTCGNKNGVITTKCSYTSIDIVTSKIITF